MIPRSQKGPNVNALDMARSAYTNSAAPIRTEQGAEIETFARVTQQLQSAKLRLQPAQFAQALHDNRKLWTLLAIDVADAGNQLPQQLRAQIFYLAEFTDQHTSKVLAGNADPAVLVEVNTAVMRGLRQQSMAK